MSEQSPTAQQDQDESTMLRVDPQRASVLAENLGGILQRISAANTASRPIRLIAVSKLKPATDILALHRPPPNSNTKPHFDFGENYAQELTEKAALLPHTIKWHFIGALQTNKCKNLAQSVRNLECVGSVDSEKKATELEKGRVLCLESWREEQGQKGKKETDSSNGGANGHDKEQPGEEETDQEPKPLNVHVQVNTSGEDSKSGVDPPDTSSLCRHILTTCPHLRLRGLMTIGAIARSQEATTEDGKNEDFITLKQVRDDVEKGLQALLKENGVERLELSMGMSADFEAAIRQGADEVRVGSDIFGERPARKDFKVKEDTAEEKA